MHLKNTIITKKMENFKWLGLRITLYLLVIGITALMPGMLLYYLGYLAREKWNQGAIKHNGF